MSIHDQWTVEGTLAALDEHLYRARGVCPGTRRYCARFPLRRDSAPGEQLLAFLDNL